ncbi:MAG: B12-binding domain-containing radical SAM protein [Bacteroidetes bacterium]|nr:MAG: B12-binding domain-containing radical SAM protein [Bacteroidota bacterium]
MKKHPVVFVVKKEYDNLGIGYMSSVLHEAGFKTKIIDATDRNEKILKKLKKIKPLLVGFSVIYQYHIDQFTEMIGFLREGGISCHFTAGGHYASLKYEELLKLIPWLDSVVRFEGEYTIRELAECIYSGKDWRQIESISYTNEEEIIANPLRPLEQNLDRLPYPVRSPLSDYAFSKKFSTLLAGRGCVYNCSFCNLREFYLPFPGQIKRTREPEMVVREMDYLFKKKGCSIFLFQDDDFPVKGDRGSYWIERFCNELKRRRLSDKIIWKINCRPDEVEEKSFAMMKSNGLFLAFIGIEDGTNAGLKRINKHLTVARSLAGINTLKKLEIGFDFGFMLFQPATTFRSLNENLDFLKVICGDGYSPVTLLKMMPYYKTRIEKELMAEGRIKGEPGYRDYDFLEAPMNDYFEFITGCFSKWTRDPGGVVNISKWARNYISVCSRYYDFTPSLSLISMDIKNLISESNLFLIEIMKELSTLFESGKFGNGNYQELKRYRKNIKNKHEHYRKKINNTMINLVTLVELQR